HYRMGARPFLAHTQHAYAAMLLVRGRRNDLPRARTLLEQAVTTYDGIGMAHDAAVARALLAGPSNPAGLTAREVEVLRLTAAGMSNVEIADALVLSIRTVERHISTIYSKIGAHGSAARAVAVNYALSHHLLDA